MPQLALLFLTNAGVSHVQAYQQQGLWDQCSLYIHPKYPKQVPASQAAFVLPAAQQVKTKWGDASIVRATLALLQAAFQQTDTQWFALCSEDAYPVRSYADVSAFLQTQEHSLFDRMEEGGGDENKTSQFWVLSRADADLVLRHADQWDKVLAKLPKKKAPDELFFLTLLKQVQPGYVFTNAKVCYTKWFSGGIVARHPTTFRCLTEADRDALLLHKSLFLRKTFPSFTLSDCPAKPFTCFVVYGTETQMQRVLPETAEAVASAANLVLLSLVDTQPSSELTSRCTQMYSCVWSEEAKALEALKGMYPGPWVVVPEAFQLDQWTQAIRGGSMTDGRQTRLVSNVQPDALAKWLDGAAASAEAGEGEEAGEEAGADENKQTQTQSQTQTPVLGQDQDQDQDSEVVLQLGDVVQIRDPTNERLDNRVFLIDYIDPGLVRLVDAETLQDMVLRISPDRVIGDGTLTSITVLSRNPQQGYARQHDLLPGTWVNLYFGGDLPAVITAKITQLDNDMIELRTTDGDTLYLDFQYQGLPRDLPLESIEVRPPLASSDLGAQRDGLQEGQEGQEDEGQGEERGEVALPAQAVRQRVQKVLFDLSDLEFGDVVRVEEQVQVDAAHQRFDVQAQANDLLEELLSSVPQPKRTASVLNQLHTTITRFLQLRQIASRMDAHQHIQGVLRKSANDRPLAEYLGQLRNELYWVLLVASNVKKAYYAPNKDGGSGAPLEEGEGEGGSGEGGAIEWLAMSQDVHDLTALFAQYKQNAGAAEGQSQYQRLYQSLDPYFTPFARPPGGGSGSGSGGLLLAEGGVQSDLTAIVDTLGDLYSSVVHRAERTARRFVVQRYNLGQERVQPDNLKGSQMVSHRVRMTPNDPIAVRSVLTLPAPAVQFSHINLPGTDLLTRANLNRHFLNYWQMLKQQTQVDQVWVPATASAARSQDDDRAPGFDLSGFGRSLTQYMLAPPPGSSVSRNAADPLVVYKQFLSSVVPKTRVLFRLVQKYVRGNLSVVDVARYLEPFLVQPSDLTYVHAKDMVHFLHGRMRDYQRAFKEHEAAFKTLRWAIQHPGQGQGQGQGPGGRRGHAGAAIYTNPLFDLFDWKHRQMQEQVLEAYGLPPGDTSTPASLFLKTAQMADYGNLYNTAVALTNVDLMFPRELSALLEADQAQVKQAMARHQAQPEAETCAAAALTIAKQYHSLAALREDDGQPVLYYDKAFDQTPYDLLDTKYKKYADTLTRDELQLFLAEELRRTGAAPTEAAAEHLAEALVQRARRVREGDYAVLAAGQQMQYFRRQGAAWVLDETVDPSTFVREPDVLCNLEYDCLYQGGPGAKGAKCESAEVARDTLVANALRQILGQFDRQYEVSQQALDANIHAQLDYFARQLERLRTLRRAQWLQYNTQKQTLALAGQAALDEAAQQVVSPHARLRDLVLGQADFVKRQSDVLQFARMFCREGDPSAPSVVDGEMESEWWMYCTQTGARLLPRFHVLLADAFVSNPAGYQDVLDRLKRTIGRRSDDGDAWVDMHSGEVLCLVDMDANEYSEDGPGRGVMEDTAGEALLARVQALQAQEAQSLPQQTQAQAKKRLSPDGELVSGVVSVLSSQMGLDIEGSRDWIVKGVTEMLSDLGVLEKESTYKKREEEAAKRGKKLPSYGTVYHSTLLYLTLGMYLVAVQTSIPSIRTRKTAPGCVRSFVGFPLDGEGDDSALQYVACVALKGRDPSRLPWNVLPKSEEKIAATLKTFVLKYVLPNAEVADRMRAKAEHALAHPEELAAPEEHQVQKWTQFLPPLRPFRVSRLEAVSGAVLDQLRQDMHTGRAGQWQKTMVIESKVLAFSLGIQECIQKQVREKQLLMRGAGQLFQDNACCNDASTEETALQYFARGDAHIQAYNTAVAQMSKWLYDIRQLSKSAIFLSQLDTKRQGQGQGKDQAQRQKQRYSEDTIYLAFIQWCKFHSSVPLSEDLAALCVSKPTYLNKMDTLQEKVAQLKRDDRMYTQDDLLRLFQAVSRHNLVRMSLSSSSSLTAAGPVSSVAALASVLAALDERDDATVSTRLRQHLLHATEHWDAVLGDTDTREMRAFKDYLQTANARMRTSLLDFLRRKGKMSSLELRHITAFVQQLSDWRVLAAAGGEEAARGEEAGGERDKAEDKDTASHRIYDDGLYNVTQFYKNFIDLFVVVFPQRILNQCPARIAVPEYWGLSASHERDVQAMVAQFYQPLAKFQSNPVVRTLLAEIRTRSQATQRLAHSTPVLTDIRAGDHSVVRSVLDKRTTLLLFEHYLLSVWDDYLQLTQDPAMVSRVLTQPLGEDRDQFEADYLVEQALRFQEDEQVHLRGSLEELSGDVARLLTAYLQIMMRAKKTLNLTKEDVAAKVFRLKEAEKYTFTDKLRDMTDEERAVDTLLKRHKLGLYSLGMAKGIRSYDKDHFEHDKVVAEQVAQIQRQAARGQRQQQQQQRGAMDLGDAEMEEAVEDMLAGMQEDEELRMNTRENFYDGDPWGDEDDDLGGDYED